MKIKLLSLIFFLSLTISGQTWQWASRAGGIGSDKASDIAIDKNGNSYIGGYYNVGQPASSTPTFGTILPNNTSIGAFGKDGFLAKIDKNGNWLWVRAAIWNWDERVLGVHVDEINNAVYACGTGWAGSTLKFGSCTPIGASSFYRDQAFIGKFDLNGNCLWTRQFGAYDGDDHCFDIVTDSQANVYATGFISNQSTVTVNATFGSFTFSVAPMDSVSVLTKLSPAGVFQWVRRFWGCDGERDNRIAVDSSGNVYVAGGFYGTKAFGTTTLTSSNNSRDIFVIKYDKNGNHIWSKRAGGIMDDRANGITVDKTTQKIYVTGEFRDYAYFDLDTINNNGGPGGRDIFVAKMNTSGNWLWAKKAGSKDGDERGNGICSNNKGNIFVTGQFKDTAKFGATINLISNLDTVPDIFVAAIDSLGKWQWALKGGSLNEDRGTAIACDDSCNLFCAGYYEGTAGFSSNTLSPYGKKDIYAGRIVNACFNYVLYLDQFFASETQLVLFPNPAGSILHLRTMVGFEQIRIKITIINVFGQELKIPQSFNNGNLDFDIAQLSSGIYFLNLNFGSKAKTIRFIKQ
jgi:hypothetical protein